LRPGAITTAQIAEVLGVPVSLHRSRSTPGKTNRKGKKAAGAQRSPGLLERHYSPRTRVRLVNAIIPGDVLAAGRRVAYLFFSCPADPRLAALGPRVAWLSTSGDAAEAARSLYSQLRALDGGGYREIVVERVPDQPALAAITDRLARAAAGRANRKR